jgi:hypothetical protein
MASVDYATGSFGGLEGTPKGTETKIGPFTSYVAQPATNKDNTAAIVVFYDEFGFKVHELNHSL